MILNDILYARFQSSLLVLIVSISLLVFFFAARTVQFIGGAKVLETAENNPYEIGLLIFGISIANYTASDCFRATVLNDTLQGFLLCY